MIPQDDRRDARTLGAWGGDRPAVELSRGVRAGPSTAPQGVTIVVRISKSLRFGLCLLLGLVTAACSAGPAPAFRPDYWPTTGWQGSLPEDQGMDSEQLAELFDWIADKQINLYSLLIVRNGYLVTEAYFQPYRAEIRVPIQSVTKSVTGMLVGMAIDRGDLEGVDQRLLSFFPDRYVAHRDGDKEAIRLEHLLTLTAGLACNDAPGAGGSSMAQSAHWVQSVLDQPMVSRPGKAFNYCSGFAHLLSAILQEATGTNARDLANARIFGPLGIPAVLPEQWVSDPDGLPLGGYGLELTPREMAKLGYLYLNRGQWEGHQLVPARWVAASTRQHATKQDGSGYGYLWTVYPDEGIYSALGLAGQQIHVVPDLNLVVVLTGGIDDIGLESPGYLLLHELLTGHILPAARSTGQLPADPEGVARLADRVRLVAHPVQPVPPLPATAHRISGRTYRLESVLGDLQSLSLVFAAGVPEAQVIVNGAQQFAVGLDNVYRLAERGGAEGGALPALRGRWETRETFVIQQLSLGELAELRLRLTFAGKEVTIGLEDAIFGGEPLEVHGRW
jgi:CubicO group peptidase (beta-lactamase class C family)